MPPTDRSLHNNRSRAEGGLDAVCANISVLPHCVVTGYELAAKNAVAIAATSREGGGYCSWHPKRLIFRYHYYILEFRRALYCRTLRHAVSVTRIAPPPPQTEKL